AVGIERVGHPVDDAGLEDRDAPLRPGHRRCHDLGMRPRLRGANPRDGPSDFETRLGLCFPRRALRPQGIEGFLLRTLLRTRRNRSWRGARTEQEIELRLTGFSRGNAD